MSGPRDLVRYRQKLEREIRILVLESDPEVRKVLENLLYRARLSARGVGTWEQARELARHGHYSLLVLPADLPPPSGLVGMRNIQKRHPHMDFVLTSHNFSLELIRRAFENRVLDVIGIPLTDAARPQRALQQAAQRNINRRMRAVLQEQLREVFKRKPPDTRLKHTRLLERRLSAFKQRLGLGNRVLVVEQDEELQRRSESLFLSGLHVETSSDIEGGLERIAKRDINLLLLGADVEPGGLSQLLSRVRGADPFVEVVLFSSQPRQPCGIEALREGIALYIVGLPNSEEADEWLVEQVIYILRDSRQKRLTDNLLVELYRVGLEPGQGEEELDLGLLKELAGLDPTPHLQEPPQLEGPMVKDSVVYLDQVLSSILSSDDAPIGHMRRDIQDEKRSAERRTQPRVPESQFILFRPQGAKASILAFLGNLSEGGLFIRTPELLIPGTLTRVEFAVELEGKGYMVCCTAQVVWVARDAQQYPLGPGIGVIFRSPPPEVVDLMRRIVESRINEQK